MNNNTLRSSAGLEADLPLAHIGQRHAELLAGLFPQPATFPVTKSWSCYCPFASSSHFSCRALFRAPFPLLSPFRVLSPCPCHDLYLCLCPCLGPDPDPCHVYLWTCRDFYFCLGLYPCPDLCPDLDLYPCHVYLGPFPFVFPSLSLSPWHAFCLSPCLWSLLSYRLSYLHASSLSSSLWLFQYPSPFSYLCLSTLNCSHAFFPFFSPSPSPWFSFCFCPRMKS
mmetsp:Transcript_51459/g.89884  ORF Transcript_51459/g.89884 Transcript_51459/m.89884 type:complete len:224 (-) Transcript_51459:54-725(-)